MRYCSVLNCNTDQTYKIRFHSLPKDEKLKKRRVTSQEGQVSGLRENIVLSVQNILKTNTFPDEIFLFLLN